MNEPTHQKKSIRHLIPIRGYDPLNEMLGEPHQMDAIDLAERFLSIPDTLGAPEWVITGIIPEGVGIIAGTGGVGKTTAIVPLCAMLAGLKSPACNLDIELPRQVIYVSEDPKQVMRILLTMRKFLKINDEVWAEFTRNFHVIDSRKIKAEELTAFLEATNLFITIDGKNAIYPLVVFDTASANFDLDNESDNAEVSRYMAVLKEFHSKTHASIWIVAHTAKTAVSKTIDEMAEFTARGAGAWGDNAMWTALLAPNSNEDGATRVLKIGKVREAIHFGEIVFEGSIQSDYAINRIGQEVRSDCFYCVPRKSSTSLRKQEVASKKDQERKDAIVKAIELMVADGNQYPSRSEICDAIDGRKSDVLKTIKNMVEKRELQLLKMPISVKKKNQNEYLALGDFDAVFWFFDAVPPKERELGNRNIG